MTTSTKRLDVGELLRERLAQLQDGGCKKLTVEQVIGLIGFCEFEATPTNESPAPQAEASEHAPWSEDEEDAERLLACASRRKKYGDENCECDEDGSCVECEYDMQDVLKKRYAPLKHTTTPAPQPPVEGLREALADALAFIESQMSYSQPAHDMGEEPSDQFTCDAIPVAMQLRAALASTPPAPARVSAEEVAAALKSIILEFDEQREFLNTSPDYKSRFINNSANAILALTRAAEGK